MSDITKSQIDKEFGIIFKNFRVKNNLTQEAIAEKLNISCKYISRIENGISGVSDETLINYMNILGISPNELYSKFIDNSDLKMHIELSKKISKLSSKKLLFLSTIIDSLDKLD